MPKQFKKDFKAGKVTAHARQRANGSYEIRCQHNGKKITASAKTLAEAKERFIIRLNSPEIDDKSAKKVKFKPYAEKWLNKVKKPFIKERTYNDYKDLFMRYIFPSFGERTLVKIKTSELQEFIDRFIINGKNRTAKAIYQVLKSLFDYAYNDELIERSPMAKIKLCAYEQQRGKALTYEEEKRLILALNGSNNIYLQAFVFMLYTGVRRSELSSVKIIGKFIEVETSKLRKWQNKKTRQIPISPMLNKVLPLIDVEKIISIRAKTLTDIFPRYVPERHLHELRHTFITRCQACGISREMVSLWVGHSPDRTTTTLVYTHLESFTKRQIAEIALFNYDF